MPAPVEAADVERRARVQLYEHLPAAGPGRERSRPRIPQRVIRVWAAEVRARGLFGQRDGSVDKAARHRRRHGVLRAQKAREM
jgi:hypothetical protein